MKTITYLKALSDETRLRLVNVLRFHELSVNEMVKLMEMGQSRISRHLQILLAAGFLRCRRDGAWAFYGVDPEGEASQLTTALGFLLKDEPMLLSDCRRAERLVEDRRLKTIQFFDTIAPGWDLLKQEIMGGMDLNRAILEVLPARAILVDLGCGTGDFLWAAAKKARKVIGVDSSAKMLDLARRRFQGDKGNTELRLGELEHLPLGDGEADCAVISMVLHHVSDPVTAVREIRRILGPGGRLIIAELDKHQSEEMRRKYGDRWLGFSPKEMERYLHAGRFRLESMQAFALQKELVLNLYQAIKTK